MITLTLKDQSLMSPAVELWLKAAEAIVNAEAERQLRNLAVYGTSHPEHAANPMKECTVQAWDFYPEGVKHNSPPFTPSQPGGSSRAPAHLSASYQGEPHE